jgi:Asp-tRNA(Asn)/Glu-tRNA(Gln) amidotransferase A subunit family amidase
MASARSSRKREQKLNELTASQAVMLLRKGDVSAEDYAKACLERITEREETVQAWVHLDPDYVLAQARAADDVRKAGKGIGPLHGLPVGVKDIIDTADMPTQNGSPIFKGYQPARDAFCVSALRAAGAVIMGKTVTTELATSTPNKTRNPHNPEHTPGGSSSGSAAGVADFMIPAALATQTGGSVIRPASFCGIYGLKPTLGLISRRGVTLQSHTLDTVGVYGRSLEDLALLTDVLSAHDPDDPVSYVRGRTSLSAILAEKPPLPPLFAFCKTPAWDQAYAVTREAFEELVAELKDHVQEVQIPSLADAIENQTKVMGAENAAYYGPLLKGGGLSPGLASRVETGAKVLGGDYVKAVNARETIYASIEDTLLHYTAILTPASPGPGPKGLGSTGNPVFNGMWTYLGVPCVTLPLLEADGLPFGVQLIGMRRDEGRLLRTAKWLVEYLRKGR